jgi:hypothetical protein
MKAFQTVLILLSCFLPLSWRALVAPEWHTRKLDTEPLPRTPIEVPEPGPSEEEQRHVLRLIEEAKALQRQLGPAELARQEAMGKREEEEPPTSVMSVEAVHRQIDEAEAARKESEQEQVLRQVLSHLSNQYGDDPFFGGDEEESVHG